MESTPYFVERPAVPGWDTDEHDRWKRDSTLNFPGGYIKSAYGNLIQTFTMTGSDACDATAVTVTREQHQRVNTIGGTATPIAQKSFTYNKYPKRNSSGTGTGEVITVITSVGRYSARLGGDIQDFVGWLCNDGRSQLYDAIEFTSPRGAHYGPFGPSGN